MIPLGILASSLVPAAMRRDFLKYIGTPPASGDREKTITFAGVNLGPDFPGRQIVVSIAAQTDSSVGDFSSVVVGGVDFTVDVTSGMNRGLCGVARGEVSGTVADIVLTAGASTNRFYAGVAVAIYSLPGGMLPVATAGGAASDSIEIAGAANGVTLIAITRATAAYSSIQPEGATIDSDPWSVPRLSAHIYGAGPWTLRAAGSSNSPPYDRIAGVTYA